MIARNYEEREEGDLGEGGEWEREEIWGVEEEI